MVAAASGDAGGLGELLAEESSRPSGLFPLSADPDFARLIADPQFADLRKKCPRPQPDRNVD